MTHQYGRSERLLTRPFQAPDDTPSSSPVRPSYLDTNGHSIPQSNTFPKIPVSTRFTYIYQDKGKGKEAMNPIAAATSSGFGGRLPMGAGARFDLAADNITGVSRLVDMSVACRYLAAQCLVRQGKGADATEMLGEHNPFRGSGRLQFHPVSTA